MAVSAPPEVVKAPSLGPGAIAKPSTEGGPAFAMSSADWIAIQTYVLDGLALPSTLDAFKKYLGGGAPADVSQFSDIVACYATINADCTTWQKETFPASVSLASDIYDYGTNKAPAFFKPIEKLADALDADPGDEKALKQLTAILNKLIDDAKSRAAKAADVKQKIKAFADATHASRTTLRGTDATPGGLIKKYNDKFGATSKEVTELNKEITDQTDILKKANDEYNHDVVVAATTPTYAWVWPAGTIAAAVVAGIYGKKATDALDAVHRAKAKIDQMNAQVAADALLLIALNTAESGLGSILSALDAALPIVQKIEGVWGGIADDLGAIATLIQSDIKEALPILMSLGVDEAITAWHNVALAANAYRTNAYVTQAS